MERAKISCFYFILSFFLDYGYGIRESLYIYISFMIHDRTQAKVQQEIILHINIVLCSK